MDWISSRGASPPVPFIDALFAGTAPDGGLYMPERIDPLPAESLRRVQGADIVTVATVVGAHLLRGEITEAGIEPLVRNALDFPVPLFKVTDRVWALELFHGPTMAFKDVGARVQARLLHHFTDGTPLTILVAVVVTLPDVHVWWVVGPACAVALLGPLIFYPVSFTLWQAIDLAMRPPTPGELAGTGDARL